MELRNVTRAARELNVAESGLRRAEQRGLIPRARRDQNGWRVYSEDDLAKLRRLLIPRVTA